MKKAIIKKGLEPGKVYGPCKFFNEMKTDEPLEIVDEFEAKHVYKLSNGFIYSEEMIEKVVETDEDALASGTRQHRRLAWKR